MTLGYYTTLDINAPRLDEAMGALNVLLTALNTTQDNVTSAVGPITAEKKMEFLISNLAETEDQFTKDLEAAMQALKTKAATETPPGPASIAIDSLFSSLAPLITAAKDLQSGDNNKVLTALKVLIPDAPGGKTMFDEIILKFNAANMAPSTNPAVTKFIASLENIKNGLAASKTVLSSSDIYKTEFVDSAVVKISGGAKGSVNEVNLTATLDGAKPKVEVDPLTSKGREALENYASRLKGPISINSCGVSDDELKQVLQLVKNKPDWHIDESAYRGLEAAHKDSVTVRREWDQFAALMKDRIRPTPEDPHSRMKAD